MSVRAATAILHSTFDLFAEMGGGVALGPNVQEIVRRLRLVRAAAQAQGAWSGHLALLAAQLRARASHYAAHRAPGEGADTARLAEVVRAYSEMLMHLDMQAWRDGQPAPSAPESP
ncbi:hypothetical protein Q8W71_10615 [Methylobacterium sp. NEAU 140]|uniref:hypothetical protein n=1 Tax=Methylobacterium sp. NEAU 140 TaxID=3064945 RepID=UPI002735F84E|nr:hypothetical protein [Methylobacterium sp. NEAU 140]MDP4023076.1 hypothetical protein [Methylobacterium sp. NEAU 140]